MVERIEAREDARVRGKGQGCRRDTGRKPGSAAGEPVEVWGEARPASRVAHVIGASRVERHEEDVGRSVSAATEQGTNGEQNTGPGKLHVGGSLSKRCG